MEARIEKPIHYTDDIQIRFTDLDPYGHVNSSVYLQYVVDARWNFARKEFSVTSDKFIKQGIGFIIKGNETRFIKPITANDSVLVDSFVSSNVDDFELTVDYSITSHDREKVFATGKLYTVVFDLKEKKPMPLPESARKFFWHS